MLSALSRPPLWSQGFWRADGQAGVPTGVPLTRLVVPADTCVPLCIDPAHTNSNTEDLEAWCYDVVYVYGAELSPYNPCHSCGYVHGGGDAGSCTADGAMCTTVDGAACYSDLPCACDGVGIGTPNPAFAAFTAACAPSGGSCSAMGTFDCFLGDELCMPTSCYVAAPSPSSFPPQGL